MNDDLYRKLREWMHNTTPMGFRETDKATELELLKYLFTPAEARLALHLTVNIQALETIAQSCGEQIAVVETGLDSLYLQGVIRRHTDSSGGKSYASLAFLPGIMENLLFLRGSDQRLVSLVFQVFKDNRRPSFNVQTGSTRTVPVGCTIPAESTTALYQDVAEMVKSAPEPILVFPCHCRKDKVDRCSAPLEVCLAFGDHAQFYLDTGNVAGRRIDVAEALQILRKAEDAGLVHQFINYTEDDLSWLCNCCKCCCINLSASNKFYPAGPVRGVDPSAYIAAVDADNCTGCGGCIDHCQTNALEMAENIASLKPERCIGCGQCVTQCPVDAIKLVQREADRIPRPPKNWRELIDRQHAEQMVRS
jgi:Na+-translocating ferredoxin:NAD+ oxidoreductase subunit B